MAGQFVSMKSVTTADTDREASGGGQVVKLGLWSKGRAGGGGGGRVLGGDVECWFPVSSFELNRDWVYPASKSWYDWRLLKQRKILITTQP